LEELEEHEFDPSTRCLRVALPPELSRIHEVRRMAEWLADAAGLATDRAYDLKLVLSEAVANAVEHTVVPGDVEIVAWLLADRLVVEVTNPGSFQPGLSKDTDDRQRGLGLPLMVSLADQVHVSRLPEGKTRVSLTFFRERAADQDVIAAPEGPATALVQLEAERLKVQAALAEADRHATAARIREMRFRALADFSHDWELWLALDGSITYTSPSCERITGYSPEELMADPRLIRAMVHRDDWARVRERYAAPHSESTEPFEFRIITKSGEQRWIGMSSQPVTDEDGTHLGHRMSNRDITSHMDTVQALQESEERLRLALNNARITIYAVDREQRFLWVENPDPSLGGLPLVGRTTHEVFPSPDVEPVIEARRTVIETGVGCRVECPISVDGDSRTFEFSMEPLRDASGDVAGALVAAMDITERRRAEEEILELSDRLSFHVDHSPLAVIEWGPDMRLVRWSGEAERIFGWSADEVLGKRMQDFRWIYDEDAELVTEVSSGLQKGTESRRFSRNRNHRKDGTVIYCEWYNSSLMDESGRLRSILSLVLDVTERTLAEQHVRRHGLLLETVTDAIIASDEQFIIRSWNRAAEHLYGWSEEEVLGKPVGTFLLTESSQAERECVREELLRDGRWSGEIVQCRKDGSSIWVQSAVTLLTDASGTWTGAVAVNRDMTERMQAEAARRESEDRVQMALRAADMGAWDYRLATGDVFWDERARDMWGIPRGDRIDFDEAVERIHPEDRRMVVAALESAATGRAGGAYDEEFRVVWPDGSVHWIASHGQVQFADGEAAGRAVRFIGVIREITAQKLAEEQRARANAFAQALTRVNASLTSTLEREEMLHRLVTEGSRALGCPRAALELRESGGWVVSEVLGLPDSLRGLHLTLEQASVANAMAHAGDVLAIEDSRLETWLDASAILRYGSQAVLAVPLVVRDRVMGSLQLIWTDGPRRFEAAEVDFARKLSTSIALSLENARLYEEQRTIAHTLQQALLSVPEHLPGLSFGHLHRSATELTDVGGDFYDLFPLPRGRLGIVLGDVSGRGIAAADLAALVKNTLKAYAHRRGSPARVLTDTNRLLLQSITGDLFVTAFFGTLKMETGALAFSTAGHPPALVRTAEGAVLALEHRGPVLGLFPEAEYTNARFDLAPGDQLVLYTDGLTEARRGRELLGEQRLKDRLGDGCGVPSPELPDRLLNLALEFTGGQLTDDLAILALERLLDPEAVGGAATAPRECGG
jgi:PAS domain S-box-containing protein